MRRIESWLVLGLISFLWAGSAQAGPKNVIIMIGDGFGFEQAEAGRLVSGADLVLDQVDGSPGSVDVSNVFGDITDSAAGATAIATGCKTANGNISMAADDLTELPTNMQAAQAAGKAVGILSSVYLCDATPRGVARPRGESELQRHHPATDRCVSGRAPRSRGKNSRLSERGKGKEVSR